MNENEKIYLNNLFVFFFVSAIDIYLNLQNRYFLFKIRQFIELLVYEMFFEFVNIVFVKTRAVVKLLFVLLTTHFVFKNIFRIETFIDISNNQVYISNFNDFININNQKKTLNNLRNETKNLIIAINVCEKNIDIIVCNIVIYFE